MAEQREPTSAVQVEVDGDLLGLSALSLPERLPLVDLASAKRIVLSLRSVRHIDQAGLAMLVRLYSHLRVRGAELELVNVAPQVRQTLERVGLTKLVLVVGGLEPEADRERERARQVVVTRARRET
jgi:anti-anti-sigma factor